MSTTLSCGSFLMGTKVEHHLTEPFDISARLPEKELELQRPTEVLLMPGI